MKYSLLKVLRDLESEGLLRFLIKEEDLRCKCEEYLERCEEGKRSRGRPRKECVESSKQSEDAIGRLMACEVEEEESIKVKRINIEGKDYLISETKVIYCPESHEELGSYINNKLVLCET